MSTNRGLAKPQPPPSIPTPPHMQLASLFHTRTINAGFGTDVHLCLPHSLLILDLGHKNRQKGSATPSIRLDSWENLTRLSAIVSEFSVTCPRGTFSLCIKKHLRPCCLPCRFMLGCSKEVSGPPEALQPFESYRDLPRTLPLQWETLLTEGRKRCRQCWWTLLGNCYS